MVSNFDTNPTSQPILLSHTITFRVTRREIFNIGTIHSPWK
jgi:hypothetical protein